MKKITIILWILSICGLGFAVFVGYPIYIVCLWIISLVIWTINIIAGV